MVLRRSTAIWAVAGWLSLGLSLPAGVVRAQDVNTVSLSTIVSLIRETPLYESPHEESPVSGALAPQNVHVVGAERDWLTYRQTSEFKWFRIETWQGDRWIHLPLSRMGSLEQTDMDLWLSEDTALDETPFSDYGSGLSLSSQTVHVTLLYRSKFRMSYQVDTWNGPLWLTDTGRTFFPVSKTAETLVLPTVTSRFDTPIPYRGDNGKLQPQTAIAFEKGSGGWYHVRTASGETTWINKLYAAPVGAKPTDEAVELKNTAALNQYPNGSGIGMGAIAPQTVKAFERWVSPEGQLWFHIHSWTGDAWVEAPGPYINREMALSRGKQTDPNGDAKWTAQLKEDSGGLIPDHRAVWAVTAVYPAGNKTIVYLDAQTGEQLAISESEAPLP